MFTIKSPNSNYSGSTAGVIFHNGIGKVENEALKNKLVKEYGYKDITELEEKPKKAKSKAKTASSKK